MSAELKRGVLVVDCDHLGCHKNYECEAGVFREGWKAAQSDGWVFRKNYDVNNVGQNRHYCPDHAEEH